MRTIMTTLERGILLALLVIVAVTLFIILRQPRAAADPLPERTATDTALTVTVDTIAAPIAAPSRGASKSRHKAKGAPREKQPRRATPPRSHRDEPVAPL